MTLGEWQELLELLKTLLEVVAIIAGGIWAIFTFHALGQIARARADIANAEASRRKSEAEAQQLLEKAGIGAVIEVDLTATTVKAPDGRGLLLSVLVEITNKGTRNAKAKFPEPPEFPFTAYEVTAHEDGRFSYEMVARAAVISGINPEFRSLQVLVRAGGRERLPFLVRIPRPGVYLLVFGIPLSEKEQEVAKKFDFVATGRWTAKRYVVVGADGTTPLTGVSSPADPDTRGAV
jgi:hypothetical protein